MDRLEERRAIHLPTCKVEMHSIDHEVFSQALPGKQRLHDFCEQGLLFALCNPLNATVDRFDAIALACDQEVSARVVHRFLLHRLNTEARETARGSGFRHTA